MKRTQIAQERKAQILAGALKVFSTHGFVNATNKQIAEAAGIQSPGLIYHYFKDKAEVLRSVIEMTAPPLRLVAAPARLMSLPVADGLSLLAESYIEIMNSPALCDGMRVLLGEALRDRKAAETLTSAGPLPIWKLVRDFLIAKMEAGEIRQCDPGQTAWSFIGGLFVFIFAGKLLGLAEAQVADGPMAVKRHVALILNGLAPDRELEVKL